MILVIDLNNLAHRVFHTPSGSLTKKDGTPSGVILGVLNSLRGLIQKFEPVDKVIIAIDGGRSAWRTAMYPEYKANRDYGKEDEEKKKAYEGLWMQIGELKKILPLLGLKVVCVEKQEADDIIAGVCKLKIEQDRVMIVTSDKDMLQLVSPTVSVYSPYKDLVISPLNFYEVTGVTQRAYLGYRAILGDSSDNIVGVYGLGEKTTKSLMDKYGNIDNILNSKGKDRETLLKSKRTKVLFEPETLQRLGINNRIMSFNFTDMESISSDIQQALDDDEVGVQVATFKSTCMEWQYVSILTNFTSWISPFSTLGAE